MIWGIVLGLLGLSAVSTAMAQRASIGLNAGILLYNGDLNRGLRLADARPGAGIFYRYQLTDLIGFRGGIGFGLLTADDSDADDDVLAARRLQSFETSVAEIYGAVEYRFWREHNAFDQPIPVMYLFVGIGGVLVPRPDNSETDFSTFQPIVPFGLGVTYKVAQQVIIGAELGLRKTFFDHLDNVSAGDISTKDYNVGDQFSTDWYHFVGVSVSYLFYSVRCPIPVTSDNDGY